jgi:CRP/FNR family cyclic AMP-dependent transcriptional regulator
VRSQRFEYRPGAINFAEGDPATSVMHVQKGVARLSVVSRGGKEAIVAVLGPLLYLRPSE